MLRFCKLVVLVKPFYPHYIVLAKVVSGCLLDTLFYLSFTCKCIVSEQYEHSVVKFPAN